MGDYTIKDKLGEGAMGQVYRAFQTSLHRNVALKTMSLEASKVPENVERFYREASILCQLSHPNVVPVFDTGTLGNLPFFVMELIEGTSLAQLIQDEGPLPFPRALRLIHQLADALSFLHERGIFHRDIKPQNLVLKGLHERDHLVVVDFGLARSASSRAITLEGESVGTLQYMSPETIESGDSGGPQDVWAMALVAQYVLSGLKPFAGGDLRQVAMRIFKFDPAEHVKKMGDTAPPWLKDILVTCWARDPAIRPSASDVMEILQEEASKLSIEGFLVEREVSRQAKLSRESPVLPPPRSKPRSRPVPVLVPTRRRLAPGVGIALALGGLATWMALRHRDVTNITRDTPPSVRGDAVLGPASVELNGPLTRPPPPPQQNPSSILEDFTVLASDRAASIDFTVTTREEVTVQVGPWSSREVKESWKHPAGSLHFHHVVHGLQSSTNHFVRVVGPPGKRLIDDYRFTTLSSAHRTAVEAWVRNPTSAVLPAELLATPMPEMIPGAIQRLGKNPDRATLEQVATLSRRLKDQELARALLPHLESATSDAALARLADAKDEEQVEPLLAKLVAGVSGGRLPEILGPARRLVSVARASATLAVCARALVVAGSPDDVDRVAARLGELGLACTPEIREALILCHRQRAREIFVDWQKRQIFQNAQFSGIQGLGALGESADFEIVKGVMTGVGEIVPGIVDPELPSGDVAAVTLADLGTAPAIGVLAEVMRKRRDNVAVLWSCGRRSAPGTATHAAELLTSRELHELRPDAALVLGLTGDSGEPGRQALRRLLEHSDSRVRDSAAWSLARLGDAGSEEALLRLASSERDERGIALWALARVGTERADPEIMRLLSQLVPSTRMTERSRLALACWAAAERRIAGAIPLLFKLAGSDRPEGLVKTAARTSLDVLTGTLSGSDPGKKPRLHVLLPLGWYDRTGIRLARGQSVELTVWGSWGFGPLDEPEAPAGEGIGTTRAAGFVMGVTAILGSDHTALAPGGTRLLARRDEELVLSPFRTVRPEVRVSTFPEPWGVAWVMIEP